MAAPPWASNRISGANMNALSLKIGYCAAILSIITGIGYGIGLILSFAVAPAPAWTNLTEYAASVSSANLALGSIAQLMGFLSIPLNVILFCCIHDATPNDKRALSQIALAFMLCYAAIGGITYFLQFTVIRSDLAAGRLQGLEQFMEANPTAAVNAIGVLAWNVFLGLAWSFAALVFSGSRLEKNLQLCLGLMGAISLIGGVGYAVELYAIYALYLIGIAVTGTILVVLLALFFRRKLNGPLPVAVASTVS